MPELGSVILDCREMRPLCAFYAQLLSWPVVFEEEGFMRIQSPQTGVGIAFQQEEEYQPPVWPSEPGKQQMMAHLDFAVKDTQELEACVTRALALGAVKAETQYGGEDWVTLLDPAGHPFCFVVWE